jgi:putative hydrolase of the HAD superfamily
MDAVVLDLFGTLVAAPTPRERTNAAARLARLLDCDPVFVDHYFLSTWRIRHDGTRPALARVSPLVRAPQAFPQVSGRDAPGCV